MLTPREVSILAVTVEDLLRLALPARTTVVGGKTGLGRDVAWAASLRTFPSAFPSLKGGEIALLALESLRQIEPPLSLDQIVPRLAARGVSAIAVMGEATPSAISAADEAGVPLLQLPPEVSLHELEAAIIRTISERRAELYRQDTEVQGRLTELALRGRGLGAIVQTLADLSGKLAVLQDDARRVRFFCQPTGDHNQLEPEAIRAALTEAPILRSDILLFAGPEPRVYAAPLTLNHGSLSRLVAPLAIGAELIGFLSLLTEPEAWDRLDYLFLARAASSCALEMSKERAVVEAESRLRGDFLSEVLENPSLNEEAMLERARRLGHDLSLPHAVALWRLDAVEEGQAAPIEERRLTIALRAALARSRELAGRESLLVQIKGTTAACVCPAGPLLARFVEQVRRLLNEEATDVTFSAGMGRPTTQLRSLRASYKEAEQAVAVAQRLFGGNRSASFADLGFYRLLLPLHGSGDLQDFYTEALGPLEAYDRQNHTELIHTLETFFRCDANHQLAAQELCLHRNTLAYRLKRIEELLGRNLDNLEDRFQLQLALKIRRVLA